MRKSDQLPLKHWPYYTDAARWQPVTRPPKPRARAEHWILGWTTHPVKCWFRIGDDGELGFYDADGRRLQVRKWAEKIALPNKFGAKPQRSTMMDRSFPSGIEREWAELLYQKEKAGLISDLKFQQTVTLSPAAIDYRVDFCYVEDGRLFYDEVKGVETDEYRIKERLWRWWGPAPLRVVKGKGGRLRVTKVVAPKDYGLKVESLCGTANEAARQLDLMRRMFALRDEHEAVLAMEKLERALAEMV